MRLATLIALLVPVVVYDVVGIYFLVHDKDAVSGCRASNPDVHVIWPTDLWVYILLSLVIGTLSLAVLELLAISQSVEALNRYRKRWRNRRDYWEEINKNARLSGLVEELPDWLFLMHGTALVFVSMLHFLLAFMGYFELFMARPWCDDKKTAFEELDLWRFGRVTFAVQLVMGAVFFTWGMLYWFMPAMFEMLEPQAPEPRGPLDDSSYSLESGKRYGLDSHNYSGRRR